MKLDHDNYKSTFEAWMASGLTAEETKGKMAPELTKKCKGTKKAVVKKQITFEDYEHCLLTGKSKSNKQLGFRSFDHKISTVETTKQSFNSFDSKRYWLDNFNSMPFGHYMTRQNNN